MFKTERHYIVSQSYRQIFGFYSNNLNNDKRAVVKTLMDRAYNIPSDNILQKQEIPRVKQTLILKGYKSAFVDTVCTRKYTASKDTDTVYNRPRGFTCLPFVKGISEKVKYIQNRSGICTAFKPVRTLENVFRKPKNRPDETRIKAIVYKFKCKSCNFTYVGGTKRCWCSRWLEHKPGV